MPGSVSDALVLVVDDDARNRTLACDVLLAAEFRTIVAETGQEAARVSGQGAPLLPAQRRLTLLVRLPRQIQR